MSCCMDHIGKARYNDVTDWERLGYYKGRFMYSNN